MKPLHPSAAPAANLSKCVGALALAVLGAAACQNALDLGGYDFSGRGSSAGAGGTSNGPASAVGGSSSRSGSGDGSNSGAGSGDGSNSGSGKNGGSGSDGSGSPSVIRVSTSAGGSSGLRANDDGSAVVSDVVPGVVPSASDAGPSDGGLSDAGSAELAGSADPADTASPAEAAPAQCAKPPCRSGGLLLDLLGGSRADR